MSENTLWYDHPARHWLEALPLGNGRIGVMVRGGVHRENLSLNEDSIWARGPDRHLRDAFKMLPEIRRLLAEGQLEAAQDLADVGFMGYPRRQQPYQPLGDLNLIFADHRDDMVTGYRRALNLADGIATVEYHMGNVGFHREMWVSAVDQALVMRISANQPKAVSLAVTLDRQLDAAVELAQANVLVLRGSAGRSGTRFAAHLELMPDGGEVESTGGYLTVAGANTVTLLLTVATDYRTADYEGQSRAMLARAGAKDYAALYQDHVRDQRALFDRVTLTLRGPESDRAAADRPTDQRLAAVRANKPDAGLMALYFAYGRYLLIASSRPGSLPANLQGIWNADYTPSWDSKYTININTEMNYWPAEGANLAECHLPLFDLIARMAENGRVTARMLYASRGFVAHHNTDAWADTAPVDGAQWGLWPTGAAWLCYHLWDHYDYGRDLDFLRQRAYPLMKAAAEFLLDYMTADADGQLRIGPSLSPENRFRLPDGQVGTLSSNTTLDIQIVRGLFERVVRAGRVIGEEEAFARRIADALQHLPPLKVDTEGRLMEWEHPYEEVEPGHRHLSLLFGIYPDDQLHRDAKLFTAARQSFQRRLDYGEDGVGWNLAWAMAIAARFGEADLAHDLFTRLLSTATAENLFDLHAPTRVFQIDGNLGAVAAVLEMLVQMREDVLVLLPALPSRWLAGAVTGIRVRGGLTVDVTWLAGRLASACIQANQGGGLIRVRAAVPFRVTDAEGREVAEGGAEEVVGFPSTPGATYHLVVSAVA